MKYVFFCFGRKYIFAVLAEKCIFAVLAKSVFLFEWKSTFWLFLRENVYFTVLEESSFWRKMCFYGFSRKMHFTWRFLWNKVFLDFTENCAFTIFPESYILWVAKMCNFAFFLRKSVFLRCVLTVSEEKCVLTGKYIFRFWQKNYFAQNRIFGLIRIFSFMVLNSKYHFELKNIFIIYYFGLD